MKESREQNILDYIIQLQRNGAFAKQTCAVLEQSTRFILQNQRPMSIKVQWEGRFPKIFRISSEKSVCKTLTVTEGERFPRWRRSADSVRLCLLTHQKFAMAYGHALSHAPVGEAT